ncbi:immunoglobulin-like domain-containing receptor 1a isoform X2 [Acanthochromis polyacanthus]|uniref:Immunoglobulin-like domain containing receptor 1a n=1 Tax=Acanthochromis polyacanthus TaxID=80966 RepID=A0A3Q1GFD7_9TELE|nr:immunoglobulin-like domain-containing receptor 1a isoform X2 [Acanthochromis polyacanthus]
MRRLTAALVLLSSLLKVSLCIQVIVPQQERSTALFASVILRCDFSTSANLQDVLVTWRFKSFCRDPVLEYYSTAYQSALQLGQDPSNDCPDRQRTVRTVVQKRGSSEPILGAEYRERRITIQNKADLVINEVMWWDNGVYFCAVDAPGDTTGDADKEVKLIVYHWLTVLFIIIGALLLIMLFCICCCQCCPQKCCCYVRCPCCPQQCCCPEKAVMQHRMMKEAQRAMAPWMGGQPVYGPMSHASSQINPLLYAGSVSGKSIPLKPMPLPPPQSSAYSMPPPSVHGNHTPANTNQMLDYLESQVRGMDVNSPLLQSQPPPPPHMQQIPPPVQHVPVNVPFSPGPPSMLSALDDGPAERRVITLPPIREQQLGRIPPPAPKTRPPSSSESSRSGFGRRDERGGSSGRRYPSPPRSRGLPHSYSEESLDGRGRSRSRGGADHPRSRSRDDLFDSRSRGNYSRRGSWSSDDEASSRRGGGGGGGRRGGGGWVDKPPSYTEYEPGQKPGARRNERYSDRSSRSGTSVVI